LKNKPVTETPSIRVKRYVFYDGLSFQVSCMMLRKETEKEREWEMLTSLTLCLYLIRVFSLRLSSSHLLIFSSSQLFHHFTTSRATTSHHHLPPPINPTTDDNINQVLEDGSPCPNACNDGMAYCSEGCECRRAFRCAGSGL
jgi:hypothetical protein